jgi:hypothetical protein
MVYESIGGVERGGRTHTGIVIRLFRPVSWVT